MMLESSEQDEALQKVFPGCRGKRNLAVGGGQGEAPQPQSLHIVKRAGGGRSRPQPEISPEIPLSTGGLETVPWALGGIPALRAAPGLAPCEGEGAAQLLAPVLAQPWRLPLAEIPSGSLDVAQPDVLATAGLPGHLTTCVHLGWPQGGHSTGECPF